MNHHSTSQPTDQDKAAVNYVIAQITTIFPKWRELYQTQQEVNSVKRVWMQTLVELGVTNKALVEHGLRSARASGWVRPPSAGQFCHWAWDAAQKSAGIPTLADAQSMIIKRLGRPTMKLTGAMNHISLELNWFEMRRASGQRVNDLVAFAYEKMIAHWKSGRPFVEPVKNNTQAIEDHSHIAKPLTPKQREMNKSNMKELLGAL